MQTICIKKDHEEMWHRLSQIKKNKCVINVKTIRPVIYYKNQVVQVWLFLHPRNRSDIISTRGAMRIQTPRAISKVSK